MKLSVQIIADYLQEKCAVTYSVLGQELQLLGVRAYRKEQPILPQYIYVADVLSEAGLPTDRGAYILVGSGYEGGAEPGTVYGTEDCIVLPTAVGAAQAMEWVMEAFELYNQWMLRMQDAVNRDCELEELLQLSLRIFNNPMFIHDSEFYLLAMEGSTPDPADWSYEENSGRFIFNSELVSLYKLDENYLNSLKIRGASVFPKVIREYYILICNLWQDDQYTARICINATSSEIKTGQIKLVEQLGNIVLAALKRQREKATKPQRDISLLLASLLSGNPESRGNGLRMLAKLDWDEHDSYVFIKFELSRWDDYVKSIFATCFKLENLVKHCFAFPYENDIAAIVNLTKNGLSFDEVTSMLSPFLRESLLKMGCSNAFRDFFQASEYYHQAAAALEIGSKRNEMMWSFRFENYVLEYILRYGCNRIPPHILCSRDVLALAEYDELNNTRLLDTLRVYIAHNLNSVSTAKELYIHRSTFFYRLDRIKNVIKADLKNYEQRLYIQISFLLFDEANNNGST